MRLAESSAALQDVESASVSVDLKLTRVETLLDRGDLEDHGDPASANQARQMTTRHMRSLATGSE